MLIFSVLRPLCPDSSGVNTSNSSILEFVTCVLAGDVKCQLQVAEVLVIDGYLYSWVYSLHCKCIQSLRLGWLMALAWTGCGTLPGVQNCSGFHWRLCSTSFCAPIPTPSVSPLAQVREREQSILPYTFAYTWQVSTTLACVVFPQIEGSLK